MERRRTSPRRTRAALWLAPVLGAITLAVVVAVAGAGGEPTGAFARVAAEPSRYDGSRVRVVGRVAERPVRLPERAYVLEGDGSRPLLVVAARGSALPPVAPGMTVSVRGTAHLLEPSADQRRGDRPPNALTLGDVAARTGARALIRAGDVAIRPRG
jgi:hypothetical protein